MNKALDLVGHIVSCSNKYHSYVTNLRLQPLLFFIQEEAIRQYGRPAFEDKPVNWEFGKVYTDVYYEYSIYASCFILNAEEKDVPHKIIKIIDDVVKKYANFATWELIRLRRSIDDKESIK